MKLNNDERIFLQFIDTQHGTEIDQFFEKNLILLEGNFDDNKETMKSLINSSISPLSNIYQVYLKSPVFKKLTDYCKTELFLKYLFQKIEEKMNKSVVTEPSKKVINTISGRTLIFNDKIRSLDGKPLKSETAPNQNTVIASNIGILNQVFNVRTISNINNAAPKKPQSIGNSEVLDALTPAQMQLVELHTLINKIKGFQKDLPDAVQSNFGSKLLRLESNAQVRDPNNIKPTELNGILELIEKGVKGIKQLLESIPNTDVKRQILQLLDRLSNMSNFEAIKTSLDFVSNPDKIRKIRGFTDNINDNIAQSTIDATISNLCRIWQAKKTSYLECEQLLYEVKENLRAILKLSEDFNILDLTNLVKALLDIAEAKEIANDDLFKKYFDDYNIDDEVVRLRNCILEISSLINQEGFISLRYNLSYYVKSNINNYYNEIARLVNPDYQSNDKVKLKSNITEINNLSQNLYQKFQTIPTLLDDNNDKKNFNDTLFSIIEKTGKLITSVDKADYSTVKSWVQSF